MKSDPVTTPSSGESGWPAPGAKETLAMVAHELRSPLATMCNVLSLYDASLSPVLLANLRGILDRQLRKALHLVDDLMDVARLERDDAIRNASEIDLARVVTEAVEETDHRFRAKEQTLQVEVPDGVVPIRGDRMRLQQVVVNLLDNGSKYSSVGGGIALRLWLEPGWAELSVRDWGLGILPQDLPFIFEPFFRAGRSLEHPGLGVGLSLARRLVELHGGSITATSDGPEQGSEFTVRLPST